MTFDLKRQLCAEFVGTAVLVATVVGSGIMADALSPDDAVALLGNTVATGAILYVLITTLGPISGAHFNPAVTLAFMVRGDLLPSKFISYSTAQILGAIAGCLLANFMFEVPILEWSTKERTGLSQWISEAVATAGLLGTIFLGIRFKESAVPMLVGLYITAAYWWTSSTSFANPAVTIGRMFSDTFAGISPADAPGFIIAQLAVGATIGWFLTWLLTEEKSS